MAAAPAYKVYSSTNEYLGSVKHLEDAAVLVSVQGEGATIRYGHDAAIWIEGSEGWSAGESYDQTARVCEDRVAYIKSTVGAARMRAAHARVAHPAFELN